MHIAEGFLPAAQCVAWYAVATPFVVHGARQCIKEARKSPENKILLAAAGAFTFVLSAIKLPSVTGSSSHPTGTGAGAVLFRPPVMAFLGTVVRPQLEARGILDPVVPATTKQAADA